MFPSRELEGDRRAFERKVVSRGENESVRRPHRRRDQRTFLTVSQPQTFGLRDRRLSPSVQTAPAGGDSCHHADSTARGGQLSLSYKTWLQWCASCRQQSRSGHLMPLPWSVHVEAEVLPSTPGEVNLSKDGVHPIFLSLRKYMNEMRRASLFGARQSAPYVPHQTASPTTTTALLRANHI